MRAEELGHQVHGLLCIFSDCWIIERAAIHPAMLHLRESPENALIAKLLLLQYLLRATAFLGVGLVVPSRKQHLRTRDVLAKVFEVLVQRRAHAHLRRVYGDAATNVGALGRVKNEPAAPTKAQEGDPRHSPLLQRRKHAIINLRLDQLPRVLLHSPYEPRQVVQACGVIRHPLQAIDLCGEAYSRSPRRSIFRCLRMHVLDRRSDVRAAAAPPLEKDRKHDHGAQGIRQAVANLLRPARRHPKDVVAHDHSASTRADNVALHAAERPNNALHGVALRGRRRPVAARRAAAGGRGHGAGIAARHPERPARASGGGGGAC
mmetsp:Transcript_10032/g.29779  ORF Transcript_10032/g.29779 Transcript_10032/m.29779 type:complete len:319 (+) Transcript_10032:228-1184(+)